MPTYAHKFTTYPAGNFPASDWDDNWNRVGLAANIVCTCTGTGNAIILTTASTAPLAAALTSLQHGQVFLFVAANSNSGPTTITVDSTSALTVYDTTGSAVITGINSGTLYQAFYDSTLTGYRITTLGLSARDGTVNVKQFGAVGDGSTNDTTAIQNAINYVSNNFASGIVYFPPGNPYLVTGLTVPSSVTLMGGGVGNTSIMCRTDSTVLTVNGDFAQVINLTVLGKGSNSDTGTFGATQPAVQMNGVSSRMSHARVQGGAPCIRVTTDDVYLDDVVAAQSYGIGIVTCDAVTFMSRCKLDQNWPVSQPTSPTTIAARTSGTAYTAGTVVSATGPDLNSWYIQCVTSGTSGATASLVLKNYDIATTDGSVTWKIVAQSVMDDLRISANEFHGTSTDLSGVGRYGILINGGALTFVHQFIIGQQWGGSILADTGSSLFVSQCELNTAITSGKFAVQTGGGWTGNMAVTDCTIFGTVGSNCPGVDITGGADARISGNYIKNCDTGVQVRANVQSFIIDANSITGCTASVTVASGTSNHYNITNNLVLLSSAVVDNGTGGNKTVTGNV